MPSRSRPVGVPSNASPIRNYSRPMMSPPSRNSSGVGVGTSNGMEHGSTTATAVSNDGVTPSIRASSSSSSPTKVPSPSPSKAPPTATTLAATTPPPMKQPPSPPRPMMTLSDLKKSVEEATLKASISFPENKKDKTKEEKDNSGKKDTEQEVVVAPPSSVPSIVPTVESMDSHTSPPPPNHSNGGGSQPQSQKADPSLSSKSVPDASTVESPTRDTVADAAASSSKDGQGQGTDAKPNNNMEAPALVQDGGGAQKSKRELLSSLYNAAQTPPNSSNAKKELRNGGTGGNCSSTKPISSSLPAVFQPVPEANHKATGVESPPSTTTTTLASEPSSIPASKVEEGSHPSTTPKTKELQLMKKLKEATVAKTNSFHQVTQMAHQVTGMTQQKDFDQSDWMVLLDISRKEGAERAMEWAKEKLANGDFTKRNGVRPLWQSSTTSEEDEEEEESVLRGRTSTRNSGRRKRLKSPSPIKRKSKEENPLLDLNIASQAVEAVEDVYSSKLAKFIIRKPYGGNETMICTYLEDEYDETVSWEQDVKMYLKNSNVEMESTLEVLSKIIADGSILMLHGSSNVRHGTVIMGDDGQIHGYEWREFGDIDLRNEPLGRVMYIDSQGNDGEYWLDSVYEEALKIREVYCKSVFSAAVALKTTSTNGTKSSGYSNMNLPHVLTPEKVANSTSKEPSPDGESSKATMKPQMIDVCVGTDDLHFVSADSLKKKTSPPTSQAPAEQK